MNTVQSSGPKIPQVILGVVSRHELGKVTCGKCFRKFSLEPVVLIQLEVGLLVGDLLNNIFHLYGEYSKFTTFNLMLTKSDLF